MHDPPASTLGTTVFQPTLASEPPAPMADYSDLTLDQLEAKVAGNALAVEPEPVAVEPEPTAPIESSEPPPPSANVGGGPGGHRKLPLLIGGVILLVIIIIVVILTRGSGKPSGAVQSPTVTSKSGTSTLTLPKDASFTNLKADEATIKNNLTVGQQAAVGSLTVNGNTSLTGNLSIGGTQICSSGGCTPAAGSNSYLQNSGSKQTANFFIQSAAAKSVGGVIQGAAKQTAPCWPKSTPAAA
jgi:hypothetical protein